MIRFNIMLKGTRDATCTVRSHVAVRAVSLETQPASSAEGCLVSFYFIFHFFALLVALGPIIYIACEFVS
jgi:hypothetical protein